MNESIIGYLMKERMISIEDAIKYLDGLLRHPDLLAEFAEYIKLRHFLKDAIVVENYTAKNYVKILASNRLEHIIL